MNGMLVSDAFRRWATIATFLLVLLIHFAWINLASDVDSIQQAWLKAPAVESVGWWERYQTGKHYWLGYSYALSIAFAAYALLQFVGARLKTSGSFAIGGISFSGFLAVFGCFLVGCCGSPMLGVYLSLFGASFLPFAKPLVAVVTTVLIGASWVWLRRKTRAQAEARCAC